MLHCHNVTNELDGRETGPMLRFARDYRGKITADRIIFLHAHEGNHYPNPVWREIARLVRTDYFWGNDYGNLVVHPIIGISFQKQPNGEVWASKGGDSFWVNATDMVNFLFANTSLDHIYLREPVWQVPCCSTFFLNPKLLLTRTAAEYDLILHRVQALARKGYCAMWKGHSACETEKAKNYGHTYLPYPGNIHSYIIGELFERSWSIIFTGRGRHEFNTSLNLVPLED
jgi:hypothetical protein